MISKVDEKQVKQVKLWFGKHKGQSLMEVPVSYLEWLQMEKLASGENTSSHFMQCLDYVIQAKSHRSRNE